MAFCKDNLILENKPYSKVMYLKRKLVISAIGILALTVLTSCGNSTSTESANGNKSDETKLSKVGQDEFTEALDKVKVSQDEFVGNFEIVPQNTKATKVGTAILLVRLSLVKKDADSKWILRFLTGYGGDDWMFHTQLNIKSSTGTLNVDIDSNLRDDQVESTYVSEIASYTPNDRESVQMCKIIGGEDIKFRLRGVSGKVKQVLGLMTEKDKVANLAMCTLYAGLQQGFNI